MRRVANISFKDLVNVMLSGAGERRRRVLSTDAVESRRLKNSRSGYLSKVTALYRSIQELQQDKGNVQEVSEKMSALEEAFDCFQKSHFDYVATLSKHREEWEDEAHYFREHRHKRVEFDSNVRRWIDNASKVPEMLSIAPEDSVSTAGSLRSRTSSNVSLRALKTKQAMAYLKMEQLKKKQKLLRQEEEMKLERQIIRHSVRN